MKIELNENKILFNNGQTVEEIHPFWLRERVDGDEFLDKGTQQRLFDPSTMDGKIIVKKAWYTHDDNEIRKDNYFFY